MNNYHIIIDKYNAFFLNSEQFPYVSYLRLVILKNSFIV